MTNGHEQQAFAAILELYTHYTFSPTRRSRSMSGEGSYPNTFRVAVVPGLNTSPGLGPGLCPIRVAGAVHSDIGTDLLEFVRTMPLVMVESYPVAPVLAVPLYGLKAVVAVDADFLSLARSRGRRMKVYKAARATRRAMPPTTPPEMAPT